MEEVKISLKKAGVKIVNGHYLMDRRSNYYLSCYLFRYRHRFQSQNADQKAESITSSNGGDDFDKVENGIHLRTGLIDAPGRVETMVIAPPATPQIDHPKPDGQRALGRHDPMDAGNAKSLGFRGDRRNHHQLSGHQLSAQEKRKKSKS